MRESQRSAQEQLSALQRKYEECLVMLEDSRKYMTALSPTQPMPTVHQAPLMPTPSIMNELEDAIYNDLQQQRSSTTQRPQRQRRRTRPPRSHDDSDHETKDSGVRTDTDSDGSFHRERLYSTETPVHSTNGHSINSKRRLRRGTSDAELDRGTTNGDIRGSQSRDALHDLIAESQTRHDFHHGSQHGGSHTGGSQRDHGSSRYSGDFHGSTHSLNSDTNITSVSDTWQSEPVNTRTMYGGTNKLKMVKPLEGSMTLLQWKLLAMKQTNNSLLSAEERPGVLQRNTVGAAAVDSLEGLGGLGGLEGPKGIFTKGGFKPKPVLHDEPEIVNDTPQDFSTPVNTAAGNEKDIFAYLSSKYEVTPAKSVVSPDFSSSTTETRPGSKVKVSTPPRSSYEPDVEQTPTRDDDVVSPIIRKSPSQSGGIGRLFGWS